MKTLMSLLILLLVSSAALAQDVLPFGVTLGGQAAAKKDGDGNFAHFPAAVPAGAAMGVKGVSGQVIVNTFPSDDKGTVSNGAQPAILLFDAKESKSIDANMSSKKLPSGWYAANVVAGGNTSRVLFEIK
jgi:hypothetical protein